MIYKKFYSNIIARVIIIAALSVFMAWYYFSAGISLTLIVAFTIYLLTIFNLIRYLNRTNNALSFFFDAVKNEDSTLVFSERTGSQSFNSLNNSLNLLNRKLQEARIEITVQEKYYKSIVESASTALMVSDKNGSVQLSNSSMNNLLGIPKLHNLNQLDRICFKLKEQILEIGDGESRTLSTMIGSTPRYLHINASTMKIRGNKVKLLAIQDISFELDQQELDSWQKLIRILNHEIMNSVAPITSLSATLSGFFQKGNKAVTSADIDSNTILNTIKGLSIIEEHGNGLISFVESYRSLTKLPRPKPEEILITDVFDNVSILASSIVESYKIETGKNVDISFQVNPVKMKIFVDKELFSRVILNLMKNAIEAFAGMNDAAIFLEAGKSKSGKTWIRIIDNGPGIPDEIVGNIFVPFYSTKEKGSGIGLSLSRQIVNMHKGTLNVFSNPGEGTTFIIQI